MTQSQKERELTEKIKNINLGMAFQKRASRIQQKPVEIYCGDEDRAEFLLQALGELGLNAEREIYTINGEYYVEVRL